MLFNLLDSRRRPLPFSILIKKKKINSLFILRPFLEWDELTSEYRIFHHVLLPRSGRFVAARDYSFYSKRRRREESGKV